MCAENDQIIPHSCLYFVTILSAFFCRAILVIPLLLFWDQNILKCLEAKTSFCDFFASPRWHYAVMPNCMILTRLQISFARLTRISQKKTLFFAALLTATENEGHSSCFLLLALLSFIFITIFHGKYCFHSCSHVSTPGVPSADRRRKPKQLQYRTRLHSFSSLSSGWSKKYCSIPRLYVV